MRNFKRFLAMALTMLMVVSCFAMSSFAFTDDSEFEAYQKEIKVIEGLEIALGKTDGTFGFDDMITRRQMALFITRVITGNDPMVNEQSTTNYTPFTDLDTEGDFIGAISLASNAGIIIGYEKDGKTVYNPNGEITYQDALTMLVRAAGYGSAEMDAGYPWSFILKAKEIGLTEGVVNVDYYTSAINRGTTAKLLYNFLFTDCADGKAYVEKQFGAYCAMKTLVLTTPNPNYSLTDVNPAQFPAHPGYIGMNALLEDGLYDTATTYYFPWTYIADAANGLTANELLGASFDVITIDGFKTLLHVEMNERLEEVVVNDFDFHSGAVNFKGDAYLGVNKYSGIFTTGATWTGAQEIIAYALESDANPAVGFNGTAAANTAGNNGVWGEYLVDEWYNFIEAGYHNIVFKYIPEYAMVGTGIPYGKLMTNGEYMQITMAEYEDALSRLINTSDYTRAIYSKTTATNAAARKNSIYGYFVLYNDQDGTTEDSSKWDRCFYADSQYGRITAATANNVTTYKAFAGTYGPELASTTAAPVNKTGKAITLGSTPVYCQWFQDKITGQFYILKTYDWQTKFLCYYDYNNATLKLSDSETENWFQSIANTQDYVIGTTAFPNASQIAWICGAANLGDVLNQCLLQYIGIIVDDVTGRIIGIKGNTSTDYIFDKVVAYDSSYGMIIRVMNSAGTYEYISIDTLDDYPFYSLNGFAYGDAANYVAEQFVRYDKVTVVTDGRGNSNLKHTSQLMTDETGASASSDTIIIIEDSILGPMVKTVKKNSKFPVGQYVSVNGVRYYKNDNAQGACHQTVDATNTTYADGANVVDIVWYDGSLSRNAVAITNADGAAGAVYPYASLWLFSDVEPDANGAAWSTSNKHSNYVGFTSLLNDKTDKNGRVYSIANGNPIYSTSNYLNPGIYTVIKMADGKLYIGNELTKYSIATNTVDFAVAGDHVVANTSGTNAFAIDANWKLSVATSEVSGYAIAEAGLDINGLGTVKTIG